MVTATRRLARFESLSARMLLAGDLAQADSVPAIIAEQSTVNSAAADAFFGQMAEGESPTDFSLENPWYDVNFDNVITPLDALLVINSLNRKGVHAFDIFSAAENLHWEDVNGDTIVTPLDALLVINWLNRNGAGPVPVPNVAPRAFAGTYEVSADSSVNITLQSYDANAADVLSFTVVTQPSGGVVSGAGSALTYTPAQDYVGTDTFVYQVSDGSLTAQATISVDVVNANPSIHLAEATPPSANLFTNNVYHVATFALTGENTSIAFEVEPVGLQGFESFYLADEFGNRLSANVAAEPTITIEFTQPYSGRTLRVYSNTSGTPVTYGGALRATALNGEGIVETFWSKLHRVNAAN